MSWLEDLLGYKAIIDTSTGSDVEKPQREKLRFIGAVVADNNSLGTTDVTIGGNVSDIDALSLTLGPGTDQSTTGLMRVAHGQTVIAGRASTPADRPLLTWGVENTNTLELGSTNVVTTQVKGQSTELLIDSSGTNYRMVQLHTVAAGRRVLGLVSQSGVTSTNMPANTGDRVMFIADRATAPTANASGGHIYYSDTGRPAWQFNSISLRLDSTSASASAGGGAALPATVAGFIAITINGATG